MSITISVIGQIYYQVQNSHTTIKHTKELKKSLFYLEYGRYPRAGLILVKELLKRDLNNLTYKRQEALEQSKAALTFAVERIKWYYDKKVQSIPFKVGDKVLLKVLLTFLLRYNFTENLN